MQKNKQQFNTQNQCHAMTSTDNKGTNSKHARKHGAVYGTNVRTDANLARACEQQFFSGYGDSRAGLEATKAQSTHGSAAW